MFWTREGRSAEAEGVYQYAVAVYQRMNGPEDRATLVVQDNIRSCHKRQGKLAEAEALPQLKLI